MKLINATGERSKLGRVVKQSSKQRNAFVYASLDETAKVFIIAEDGVPNGGECFVVGSGMAKVFVKGEVKRGNNIRSRRNWDSKDAGACYISKAEDVPYINIGVALEDGKNQLVDALLHIYYERLVDTAWDDLRAPASGINPAGSVAPPAVNTTDGSLTFSTNDAVCVWFQLPHDWKEGTDLHLHIHWSKSTSASGTVNWQTKYKWANIGDTMPSFSSLVSGTVKVADSDTADKHALLEFADISGTGKTLSSMLCVYLIRTLAGDSYAADANLYEIDIHYERDSFGSRTEYTK
jgi:hypothetical protein